MDKTITNPPLEENSPLEVNLNMTISLDEREIAIMTKFLKRIPTEEDLLDLIKVTFIRGGSHRILFEQNTGRLEIDRRMGMDLAEVLALSVSEHSMFQE